jgi:7,8-dihydropterin-6-yl-methyl-4-(beta-D-ribofuranosyl)aminobenzene 5'-phosphate synthase
VTRRRNALVAAGAVAAGLGARYTIGATRVGASWLRRVEAWLTDLGEVDSVSILPLVERLSPDAGLVGEPGLSYLVRTPQAALVFDCGLGAGKHRSALASNAERLGVALQDVDAVVITHLHRDHVGGQRALSHRTFSFSSEPLEPQGVPAHVPLPMRHNRAEVVVTDKPRVIAQGVAVLPPLPRMLFWTGMIAEQALVVNVRGFGLVLVSGCGHPAIERILAATERSIDVPIAAVVGGMHLPVHALGTPLVRQAVLGTPHWPWRPIDEDDAGKVVETIRQRGPKVVALSSHDSTPWTFELFARVFGERYRTLRVGEMLRIDASTAGAGVATT